jgi:manganese/zinc/iron transport system permease protein
VGAILVIAFLSGPPAIAYLLTGNFRKMLVLSCAFGILCSIIGYYLAKSLDVSVAGSISVVIGGVFAIVFTATTLRKSKIDVISN